MPNISWGKCESLYRVGIVIENNTRVEEAKQLRRLLRKRTNGESHNS